MKYYALLLVALLVNSAASSSVKAPGSNANVSPASSKSQSVTSPNTKPKPSGRFGAGAMIATAVGSALGGALMGGAAATYYASRQFQNALSPPTQTSQDSDTASNTAQPPAIQPEAPETAANTDEKEPLVVTQVPITNKSVADQGKNATERVYEVDASAISSF
ncbi:hypothetical protein MP638_002562 [Amoeboaphelidium occidentale]|nr:hypothetical protein MP638_002562 [Amoeboaphelidium occidentale]